MGAKIAEKILRVDMENLEIKTEDVPEGYEELGGRGLTSKIISDEVPPKAHPLGPNNKLVFAPGIVTGTGSPNSGRLSAGGKSPLTGGIKESNAGTPFAKTIANHGIKAIIVEGKPEKDKYYLLKIGDDDQELIEADQWVGEGLYDAYDKIHDEFERDVEIAGAGIAAEIGASNAGISYTDPEGRSTRYSGRGGLGAVMASRGLKFVVAEKPKENKKKIKDKETFDKGRKKLANALMEHDVTKKDGALNSYGTSVLINIINESGALPQRNFSDGSDDRSAEVSGERKAEIIKERGGVRPHKCSPSCIIQCSEIWTKEGGKDPVGVLEYESVWALGPNCGIYDLDTIGELNRACNDLGLDTIEAGNTLAVAMEGGLIDFGDGEKALELMNEIYDKTPLGRILANGAEFTGEAFGVNRVPTIKGQSMPAYDPRSIKGIGVTYATTPMGADHTAGYAIAPEIMGVGGKADPMDTEKADLSRSLQQATAMIDTAGYCLFIAFATMDIDEGMKGMIETVNGVLGTDYSADDVMEMGMDILKMEREFNKEAGFSNEDDRIPEFMEEEELPPHNTVFDVSDEELDKVFRED
ncbi:MAG: aldehyde ferredoxin oxidoreductase C-terminal domain-containing protein [Candidatus Natronoplasma sp.]